MNTWFQKHREDALHEQSVDAEQGLSEVEVKKRQDKFGLNQLESGKKINPLTLFLGQFKDVLIIILLVAAVVSWGVGLVGQSEGGLTVATDSQKQSFRDDACSTDLTTGIEITCARFIGTSGEDISYELLCDESSCELYEENEIAAATAPEESGEGGQEALLIFAIVIAIAIIGFLNEYKAEKTVEALKKLVGSTATVRRSGKIIEIDAAEVVPGDIVILEEGARCRRI